MSERGLDLALLAQAVANLIRPGTVVAVGAGAERASVSFAPGQYTAMLQVLQPAAAAVKQHTPIAVGERVIVLSPAGDSTCGYVLRGLHGGANPAPSPSDTLDIRTYPDGATIAYDWTAHRLVVDALSAQGTLVLQARHIVIRTGEGGSYHVDHAGLATRITHEGGNTYSSETWQSGAVVIGDPDCGFSPPRVPNGEGD